MKIVPTKDEQQLFLSNFLIVRKDRGTIMVRNVFDAASRMKNAILSGPKLQNG